MDYRISGPPCRAPTGCIDPTPSVVVVGRRILGSWGLLSTHNPFRRIVLPYPRSPTGWIRRPLSEQELGDLWNVPLLLQEWFVKNGAGDALRAIVGGCPGKILHAGCFSLLECYLSGGGLEREPLVLKRPRLGTHPRLSTGKGTEEAEEAGRILEKVKAAAREAMAGRGAVGAGVVKQDDQKHDDAEVPLHIWERHLVETRPVKFGPMPEGWGESLQVMRGLLLRRWRRNILRSFSRYRRARLPRSLTEFEEPFTLVTWQHGKYSWGPGGRARYKEQTQRINLHPGTTLDVEAGRDCVRRAAGATWWEWAFGSRLMFWNWPDKTRTWARSGQPHFLVKDLPRFKKAQKKPANERDRKMVANKIEKVRAKGYIAPGEVKSLTHFFYVPKGESDIRMVYNGTSSGLNDCLFAPHFGLPVIRHAVRGLLPGYHQADIDIAEMFLNFNLGIDLHAYAGVDLTPLQLFGVKWTAKQWERWLRNFMGMKDSPYRSIQLMIIAKVLAYGDHTDRTNPFHWERIVLNLPGSEFYDPTLPWVFKIRYDGHLACDIYVYVDDGKVTGWCKAACWEAASRFSKVMSRLGIQDAARKRTEPSTTPGPWAGSVVHTQEGVTLLISDKKWDKTQKLVVELRDMLAEPILDRKNLERIRGFLIYVSRTYRWMVPYLKGLHLTIDSWREDRDEEGYRKDRPRQPRRQGNWHWNWADEKWYERDMDPPPQGGKEEVPEHVAAVPRLKDDVESLCALTVGASAPRVNIRPKRRVDVLYMMGDASGKGFGTAVWNDGSLYWESGHFAQAYREESSNFREASNLVIRLEDMERESKLDNAEIFVFTDNVVFEGTFYKGHSNSKRLNGLVLRVRQVERRTSCILHVIHVAGTRMKEAGIDGLSRGDLIEGMLKSGSDPMRFLPLSEGAKDRAGTGIVNWINSWWCGEGETPWFGDRLRLLSAKEWFLLHKINSPRLWMPAPAAMETALELFNEDRLMHPHIPHVFCVPRLMTNLWRKQLSKDADVVVTLGCGNPSWPSHMHEPLLISIVLPLSFVPQYRGPWVAKGTPEATKLESACGRIATLWKSRPSHREELYDVDGKLPGVWKNAEEWVGNLLREFLHAQREFPPVRKCLVRELLPDRRTRPLPSPGDPGRRHGPRVGSNRPRGVSSRKRRRSPNGDSV